MEYGSWRGLQSVNQFIISFPLIKRPSIQSRFIKEKDSKRKEMLSM